MADDTLSLIERASLANLAALSLRYRKDAAIPEPVSLPEWADKFRILSAKNAARPGPWETGRVEIARGPMLAVTEPGVRIITLEVSTQLMKTAFIENVIGRFIHIDPCPMLAVYPDDESAESFSKERLAPLIAETPVLRERVSPPKSRTGENTIGQKHFPGGFIAVEGAGSDVGLAMRPVRVTLCDEIDKWRPNKGGDPLAQAEERTSTFVDNRLNIRCCSPRLEETSRIHASYLQSDMRKAFVACPHCGFEQTLDFFKHVHWQKIGREHIAETAQIECEVCHKPWTERQRKTAMIYGRLKWFQTKKFIHCREAQDPIVNRLWEYDPERNCGYALCRKCNRRAVPNHHAGFNVSKLYSPYTTIVELASLWLEAKDDQDSKQAFYNQQLALPFKSEMTKKVDTDSLVARREIWNGVLNQVVVLTTGVDVHPTANDRVGRFEIETVGWSESLESWSIDFTVLFGDPAKPDIWTELDEYLLKHWEREDARKMRIMAACVDSGGHNTEEVYAFCRPRAQRNVWAIKGASDRVGQWSPVWPQRHLQRNKKWRSTASDDRYRPVIIGVNAGKEAIRQRLLIEEPGPGYCHFPAEREEGYFDQLTAENLTYKRKGGIIIREWFKPSHRSNEALDVRVYAYAALQGLIIDRGFNLSRVARMLQRRETAGSAAEGLPPAPAAPVPPAPAPLEERAAAIVAPVRRMLSPAPVRRVSSYARRSY